MRRSIVTGAALALAASLAPTQMQGTYTIGPTGGNFKTINDAAKQLYVQGVSGPVRFQIVPGTYTENIWLLPAQGASSTNTITFTSLLPMPGSVKVQAPIGDLLLFSGVSFMPNSWYIIDNIEFVSAPQRAVYASDYCSDIEFRNCIFQAGFATSTTTYPYACWYINGANNARRWHVHHNTFVCPAGSSRYGLYLSQIDLWDIHHNAFDCNNAYAGIYTINLNNANNNIWNNLFYGQVYGSANAAALKVDASNYNNNVTHNTFAVVTATGNAISTQGYTSGTNKFYDNIIMVLGGGCCMRVYYATGSSANLGLYMADNNIYWAPGGSIGWYNAYYTTLPSWQAAVAAMNSAGDSTSLNVDPMLVAPGAPYDLHIAPNSPAKDAAKFTPAYVKDDYEGKLRDLKPDQGAYEVGAGFGVFGKGCPGTGSIVPEIGYTGTAAMGSTNFAFTVAKGLGGAPAFLTLGASKTSWSGIPLPIDLGGGCALYSSITQMIGRVLQGSGAGNGTDSLPLPIPNNPALAGAAIHCQWLILDAGSGSAFGLATTAGGSLLL